MLRTLRNDLERIPEVINVSFFDSFDTENLHILDIKGNRNNEFIEFLQKLGFEKNNIYLINSEKAEKNKNHIEKCLKEMRKEIKEDKFSLTDSNPLNENQEQDIGEK